MKAIIRFAVLSLAVVAASCKADRVAIHVTIDTNMYTSGQWAYLFSMYGNQLALLDSCKIENNQFRLSGTIPEKEVLAEVLIPNKLTCFLAVAGGEKIKFHIDSTTRSFFPTSEGSFATSQMTHISKRYRDIGYQHIDSLKHALATLSPENPCRQSLSDSILEHERELNTLVNDALNNTRSALLIYIVKTWYLTPNPNVDADSIKRVDERTRKLFPKSTFFTTINDTTPELTLSSMKAYNRKAQLTGSPLPYPNEKADRVSKKIQSGDYPAYKTGDIVSSFSLINIDDKQISLENITTDYLLIDFWASWCTPCRREIPHIIDARKIYSNLLTVYAISVDDDGQAWQKAINENSMENFINVRLDEKDSLFKSIIERFDVRAIPRNFLLDKDRRIIAIDLRGEALEQKMKELTGE